MAYTHRGEISQVQVVCENVRDQTMVHTGHRDNSIMSIGNTHRCDVDVIGGGGGPPVKCHSLTSPGTGQVESNEDCYDRQN